MTAAGTRRFGLPTYKSNKSPENMTLKSPLSVTTERQIVRSLPKPTFHYWHTCRGLVFDYSMVFRTDSRRSTTQTVPKTDSRTVLTNTITHSRINGIVGK